jgi:hypothetical protein
LSFSSRRTVLELRAVHLAAGLELRGRDRAVGNEALFGGVVRRTARCERELVGLVVAYVADEIEDAGALVVLGAVGPQQRGLALTARGDAATDERVIDRRRPLLEGEDA